VGLGSTISTAPEYIELSTELDYGGLAVLRYARQRFGMEKLLPMCAAACELCQQGETFDEDDLYEATTRFETTPSRNCDMLLRSQCAFPRELVEVRRWTKSRKAWSEQRGGI
jgi:hypothetical protein